MTAHLHEDTRSGQSHGAFKFVFNSLFYSGGVPSAIEPGGKQASPELARCKELAESVAKDLAALVEQGRAAHTADTQRAAAERRSLDERIASFRGEHLTEIEQFAGSVEGEGEGEGEGEDAKRLLADTGRSSRTCWSTSPPRT